MFPYPVLTSFTDDYSKSTFEATIEKVTHGFDFVLYFQGTLHDDGLQKLIQDGMAEYVYHLECSQTGYRMAIRTSDKMCNKQISHKDVCGKLQICPFIVAKQDIKAYSNAAFHPDYSDVVFDIEAGCVLAIGSPRELFVEKEIDDLSRIPSIFSIIRNVDPSVSSMTVDTSRERIIILVPMEDFAKYSLIDKGTMLCDTLNSMVVVPALLFALDEVKRMPPHERYQYEDNGCIWYTTIKKVLSEQFNCDIESMTFDSMNSFELAQRLINEPLHNALDTLLTLGDNRNGGSEE